MPNKKPYFPNNWKAYKESPDNFFIPLTYKDFFNWKVMGWVLPSSIACVIREERDGKITEKIYSQSAAADNYLTKQMSNKDNETIYTIVDDKQVQVLYPESKYNKTYKQLPRNNPRDIWPGLEDLTDEELDDLFGHH